MPRAAKPDLSEASCAHPGWSRSTLDAVGGWKLGLQITDFVASSTPRSGCRRGGKGQATHMDRPVGSGGTCEEIAHRLEGGFVGRALHRLPTQRAAFEPLDRAIAL